MSFSVLLLDDAPCPLHFSKSTVRGQRVREAQNVRIPQISDGGAAAGTEGSVFTHEQTRLRMDYNPGSPGKMVTSGEGKVDFP